VADVHAELEGAGRHDAEHVARAKPLLHRSPPRGQVSAAVPAHDPASPVLSATDALIVDRRTSVARRLCAKAIVAIFRLRKRATSPAASPR